MKRSSVLILFFVGVLITACAAQPGRADAPVAGIAFVSDRGGDWDIYLLDPQSGELANLTNDPSVDSEPAWSVDGTQIIFRSRRDGSSDIFLMGADGSDPVNLIRDPAESLDDEFSPSLHPDGVTIAMYTDRPPFPEGCQNNSIHQLAFMTVDGGKESIHDADFIQGEEQSMAWSFDGETLAFSSICNEGSSQIYLWQPATETLTRLTDSNSGNFSPAWSHDGKYLAFSSGRDGNTDIYILELGSGEIRNLTEHPARDSHPTWSPDDSQIAFVSNRDGNEEIYVISVDGGEATNLTNSPADDFWPSWSPAFP